MRILMLFILSVNLIYCQKKSNQGKYILEPSNHKNGITLYNNLKVFSNAIATEKGITSFAHFSHTPFQTQHASLGLKLIKTGFINSPIQPVFSGNNGNLPANMIYKWNNRLNQRNQIFMYFEDKYNRTVFRELIIPFYDGTPYVQDYKVEDKIEFNENGNIETYRVNQIVVGNGIGAFIGTTSFDKKKYLFIHKFTKNLPYERYDFIGNSKNFKQIQNTIFFSGTIKTQEGIKYLKDKPVWLDKIFKTNLGIYAFFKTNNLEALISVKLKKDGSLIVFSDAVLKSNYKIGTKYSTGKERISDVHYMAYSWGFLNHYYENHLKPNQATVELYNPDFKQLFKIHIDDIKIQHAIEYSHFVILGGYTESKGYRGYANPKIVVIDRKTKRVTYEKVIPLKNHQVDFMNLTQTSGEILITIGSPCCKSNHETDNDLKPQIIIDKLQSFGVFENDLYTYDE